MPVNINTFLTIHSSLQSKRSTSAELLQVLSLTFLAFMNQLSEYRSWYNFTYTSGVHIKVKVEIYSPVSSASAALLTLHNEALVTGPCLFKSHISTPRGAYTAIRYTLHNDDS